MNHPLTKRRTTSRGLSSSRLSLRSTSLSAPAAAPTPSSVGRSCHTYRPALVRRPGSRHDTRADTQLRTRAREAVVCSHRGAPCHAAAEDCLLLRQEARGLPSLALSVARSHPNGSQSARLRPNGIAKIPIAWRPALPRNGSLQQTSARMLARSAEPLSLDSRRTLLITRTGRVAGIRAGFGRAVLSAGALAARMHIMQANAGSD